MARVRRCGMQPLAKKSKWLSLKAETKRKMCRNSRVCINMNLYASGKTLLQTHTFVGTCVASAPKLIRKSDLCAAFKRASSTCMHHCANRAYRHIH